MKGFWRVYKCKGIGKGGTLKESDRKRMNKLVDFMAGKEIKVRKKRKKETKPREQPERELRNEVIKQLRKRGCIVWRIENSIGGRSVGLPDLLIFNPNKNFGAFCELKSGRGVLSKQQKYVRELCLQCGIKHYVVRELSEAMQIFL